MGEVILFPTRERERVYEIAVGTHTETNGRRRSV
jgi:hypothetical protein